MANGAQVNQPEIKLPETQQQVAQQAFESAVSPLRKEFGERLGKTTEQLAQRGIQFGGVGQQRLGDVFSEQSRIEGQIASGLGAQLGQSALEQAFSSNEAAKARQFQAEQDTAAREFSGGQAGLERQFVAEQAGLGRGLTREQLEAQQREAGLSREFAGEQAELGRTFQEQSQLRQAQENRLQREFGGDQAALQRQFAAEEALLGRAFSGNENQAERTRLTEQARLQREFAGDEAAAARAFNAEQNLLGRTFNAEESQRQREFVEAEQEKGLEFQATQADLQRQEVKNENFLNLVLSGNIENNEDALAQIRETYGPGVVFSSEDEADMRRIAAASGLSVEDYTSMKTAIGEGQLAEVLENPEDFILNPDDLQQFQIRMAELEAESAARAADSASGGGKVLCTELNRQGLLPDEILAADLRIASTMDKRVVSGYHLWAKPIVKIMRKSKIVTYALKPFISSWAYHMAFIDGLIEKDSILGKTLEVVGIPICLCIFKLNLFINGKGRSLNGI